MGNGLIFEFNLALFQETQLASEYLKNSAKYSLCREIINFLKFGGQKDSVLINIKLVNEGNIEKNYGNNETESSPQVISSTSPDVSSETALIIDM